MKVVNIFFVILLFGFYGCGKTAATVQHTSPNGKVKVEIFLHNENIWLTQERIAELFGVQRPAITKHLKNIFESGELAESAASSILEHTAADGVYRGQRP